MGSDALDLPKLLLPRLLTAWVLPREVLLLNLIPSGRPQAEEALLFCRLARQFTALSQNICAINFYSTTWKYFRLSWYYLKAEHRQKYMSSDKLGRLEQPLPFPLLCDLYTLQFSFPMQHELGSLRLFNHICQVTMSVFQEDHANSLTGQIRRSCLVPHGCPPLFCLLEHAPAALQEGATHLWKT